MTLLFAMAYVLPILCVSLVQYVSGFKSVSQWSVRPKVPLVSCGPPQHQFSCQCALTQFQHVQTCTPTSNALSAHYCGPIHPSFCMHASLFHSYFIQGLNHASILRHSSTHGPFTLLCSCIVHQ